MATYRSAVQAIVRAVRSHPLTESLYHAGTYARPGASVYDPATGTVTQAAGTSVDVRVRIQSFEAREIDNVLILHTDRKLSLQQFEVPDEPQAADTVTIGTTVYQVVMSLAEAPSFTWNVQGRRQSP